MFIETLFAKAPSWSPLTHPIGWRTEQAAVAQPGDGLVLGNGKERASSTPGNMRESERTLCDPLLELQEETKLTYGDGNQTRGCLW